MKRVIPVVLVLMCSIASAEAPKTALAADPSFMAKVASYHGITPMRLANQSDEQIHKMVLDYLAAQRRADKEAVNIDKDSSGQTPAEQRGPQ